MEVFLGFVCSIAVWFMYHRLFSVTYFSLSRGCALELIISFAIGFFLANLIIEFWFISIIVVILFVASLFMKNS